MMTSMRMAPPPMMRRPPSHPCSADMQRTRCADVACLKRNARALSPPCLGMLMDAVRAEPSPAAEEPSSYSSSSYQVIVSDADGTRRFSSSDGAAPPAEVAELMGWLPGELSAPGLRRGAADAAAAARRRPAGCASAPRPPRTAPLARAPARASPFPPAPPPHPPRSPAPSQATRARRRWTSAPPRPPPPRAPPSRRASPPTTPSSRRRASALSTT